MPLVRLPAPIAAVLRRRRLWVRLAIGALAVWGVYFGFWRYHLKRFQVLRPGVFYRVAQPTEFGLQHLVHDQGIKTILSLQLFDPQLNRGYLDPGLPDGCRETEFVGSLGVQHVQWPMGHEACWPWVNPWQFEEFFKLVDDPANWPIAVHCMGGRHRTGTVSALFRLEYDRWPVEQAMTEMYSFKFGLPIAMQEYNLRTYLPRPHPDAAAWNELRPAFAALLAAPEPADYEALVRRLCATDRPDLLREMLGNYLSQQRRFSLPLAQRLIDRIDDPLCDVATRFASQCLARANAAVEDWQMAAALVADFGTPDQQRRLLELISAGAKEPSVTLRYAALVAGIGNRYTDNRLPYLRPLVEDERLYLEPGACSCRYCDAAVTRIAAITDRRLLTAVPSVETWNQARQAARVWLDGHTELLRVSKLIPPDGNHTVLTGDGRGEEDLSRMRR